METNNRVPPAGLFPYTFTTGWPHWLGGLTGCSKLLFVWRKKQESWSSSLSSHVALTRMKSNLLSHTTYEFTGLSADRVISVSKVWLHQDNLYSKRLSCISNSIMTSRRTSDFMQFNRHQISYSLHCKSWILINVLMNVNKNWNRADVQSWACIALQRK